MNRNVAMRPKLAIPKIPKFSNLPDNSLPKISVELMPYRIENTINKITYLELGFVCKL